MTVQEHSAPSTTIGPCSDCGIVVERRMESIDGFTHSPAQLCPTCWNAYRQRQVFAGGCCGLGEGRGMRGTEARGGTVQLPSQAQKDSATGSRQSRTDRTSGRISGRPMRIPSELATGASLLPDDPFIEG